MPTPKQKELEEKLKNTLAPARTIADKCEQEGREFTPEEREQVKAALDEAKKVKDELTPFHESDSLKSLLGEFGPVKDSDAPEGAVSADKIVANAKASLGSQFVNAPEFKDWLKVVAPTGVIPNTMKGIQSPPLQFGGLKDLDRNRARAKALITGDSDTSAGALIEAMFLGMQDPGTFMRPLTLRDIITVGQTGSDAVEFVRVTTVANNAAPVAEATTAAEPTQDGTTGPLVQAAGGGYKPESDMALEKVTTPVKTVAHWMPATKKALSDAAQVRTLIDQFLDYGLEEELEDQIVSGDGTGENFDGITSTTGVQTHAVGTDTRIIAARRARRKVRTVGRATPNAYLFHPEDWEEFDIAVDNEQRYYFGGPMAMGTPRLWGLPVIESEAVPVGTGYVGDFRSCVLWDREQASISVSDSHADFFVRNLIAILAELRAAFGILRPTALVKITGL